MRGKILATACLLLAGLLTVGAGCGSKKRAKPKDVIRIGAALSETGKFAREGQDVRRGYEVWKEWVNARGGIQVGDKKYKVELVYYDDESNPDTSAKLTEKLITQDQVDFLLGPYSSGLTKSASLLAEKYGKLMVEGNGAADSLFDRGLKNLFAVLTPAGSYCRSALEELSRQGARTIVLAYEDTPFPSSIARGVERWAGKYGLTVLASETYPKDVTDVSAIINKFKALNPDVFIGGGHFNDALLFVRAAKALNFSPKAMLLTVGPSNAEFAKEVGKDAEYILGPTQWEASMKYKDAYFGTAAEYARRYTERWKEPPSYQAAESTAAALVLQLAIEKAGSLDTDKVRAAMRALDETTFYGPIKFDGTGKNVGKPMGTIQILGGKTRVVAPAASAVSKLVYPMPPWSKR